MLLMLALIIFFGYDPIRYQMRTYVPADIKEYSSIVLIIFLVLSFLIGYLNDSLSSWLEHYLIYRVMGTPTLRLLRGRGDRIFIANADLQKIRFFYLSINQNIRSVRALHGFSKSRRNAFSLFKIANSRKDSIVSDSYHRKLSECYRAYIFARNIFFAYCISAILVTISMSDQFDVKYYIVMFFIFLILMLRRKDRSYYYSKVVLLSCCH